MQEIGMFEAKTNLAQIIKDVHNGAEICLTNRNQPVAYIIPVAEYRRAKHQAVFTRLLALRKRMQFASAAEIIAMRDEGRK